METAAEEFKFDSYEADIDPTELYRSAVTARSVERFKDVTASDVEHFHEQGYLVIRRAFEPEMVADAIEGLLDLIEGQNPNFRKGIQFEKGARERLASVPREQRSDLVRKLISYVEHDARLMAMCADSRLLSLIGTLMDAEPELWADQALLKPPGGGREKPWHQDLAYFNLPPQTPVVGAWIALDRALPENGCMYLIPGSHREGPVVHFRRRDWQICDTDVETARSVVVPLEPGGCLLFHGLLHHGTPPNNSSLRRRALQFHYFPKGIATISSSDRLAIFGSEGKDVEC